MNNSVFIADQNSRCGRKISDVFITKGYRVIKTSVNSSSSSAENDAVNETAEADNLMQVKWNCFSPFSARNIVLGLKQYDDIKHAVIILSSPETGTPLHQQTQVEIQKALDFYVRSQILLAREIINEFSTNSSFSLFFVLNQSEFENPYKYFFKSFINSVLQTSGSEETMIINAFETGKESLEIFSDFLFQTIQEKGSKSRGKWFRQSFLGSLGI